MLLPSNHAQGIVRCTLFTFRKLENKIRIEDIYNYVKQRSAGWFETYHVGLFTLFLMRHKPKEYAKIARSGLLLDGWS